MATRVLLALELLQHELSCSDEQICSRLRTDLAVRYVCGILEIQVDGSQEHFVLPEVLAQFRSRIDTTLMDDLLTLQAAAAMMRGWSAPRIWSSIRFPFAKERAIVPPQFGRKPGMIAEPASGCIFAAHLPVGNPSDHRYVLPLVNKVQHAITQVTHRPRPAMHSLAGDLALNDTALREALHARGILTVGIPRTFEPLTPTPTQEDVRRILYETGLSRQRTPAQVHLACACGYSRPVVESIITRPLCRGAERIRYHGHRGAILQLGMTVMQTSSRFPCQICGV
jgi:hypothetical protein